MKTAWIRWLVVALLIASCKKVINVDIHNVSPQVVIVGEVTNVTGPYKVSISKSVNFSDSNNFPPVSGAGVIIYDQFGLRDSLTESSPGIYSTHPFWTGNPGYLYTLDVHINGVEYKANSVMPVQVPLDSVGFFFDNTRGKNTIIEPIPYYQDPPGIRNYYQFKEAINGHPINKIFIFDDRFSDGKYIHEPLFDDSSYTHMQPGDILDLSMYCIDSATYGYLSTLQDVSGNSGFQSVTPANPNTNFSGGALGYFSAHTIQVKTLPVP
jgi:hypothetical protein